MRALLAWLLVQLCAAELGARHAFYRSMRARGAPAPARRLFGGVAASLQEWGATCALLDRYWATRCSGAVVSSRWVLTAAHCVTPALAYVKYNAVRPAGSEGAVAAVHYLYRHPEYAVEEKDEGRGMDVTLLHHDVGLVRTRGDMRLTAPPPAAPLDAMLLYDARDLADQEVQVMGFGRTELERHGERLVSARMVVSPCMRASWVECVCGAAPRGEPGAGVCSGDSGGPVLFRGAQVGVTSMGPVECSMSGPGAAPGASAMSVFTTVRRYMELINSTVRAANLALGAGAGEQAGAGAARSGAEQAQARRRRRARGGAAPAPAAVLLSSILPPLVSAAHRMNGLR